MCVHMVNFIQRIRKLWKTHQDYGYAGGFDNTLTLGGGIIKKYIPSICCWKLWIARLYDRRYTIAGIYIYIIMGMQLRLLFHKYQPTSTRYTWSVIHSHRIQWFAPWCAPWFINDCSDGWERLACRPFYRLQWGCEGPLAVFKSGSQGQSLSTSINLMPRCQDAPLAIRSPRFES